MAVLLLKYRHYMTALLSSTTILSHLYFQNSVLVFTYGSYGFVSERYPCACRICVTDRGNSNWFRERYDPNVPLLLNSTNSVLCANVSRWWEVRKFAFLQPLLTLFYLVLWLRGVKISLMSLKEVCFAHQGCIYLIQNIVKTVILWNIITSSCFLL